MMRRFSRAVARRRTSMLGTTALVLVAGLSQPVIAAEDEGGGGVERIVITATFRETDVQDTPLAVTAVNAATLEARSQTNIYEVSAQTPNVTLRPHGQAFGASLVAFIRGVGQTDFNFASEPGVSMYVDDVYYSSITGNLLELLDLERVEILRGPQGTLAGKNSIGGAIKLFTREPTGSGDGFVEGTYGSFERVDVRAAADWAITDNLFARFSGASRSRDGYVTRLDYTCMHPDALAAGFPQQNVGLGCKLGTEGGQSYTGGRFALRWLAADNFEVNLVADATSDRSEVQPGVLVQATAFDPAFVGAAWPPFAPHVSVSGVPIFFDADQDGVFDADNGDLIWQPGEDIPFDNRFITHGPNRGDSASGTDGFTSYANYIDNGQNPVPSQCALDNFVGAPDLNGNGLDDDDFGDIPGFLFPGGVNPFLAAGGPGCADYNQFKPLSVPPINHFSGWGTSLTADWDIAPNFSLTSITAYRTYENTFANDDDGTPLAVQQLLQHLEQDQWSQEVRLNGALFSDMLDFTLGGFYQERDGTLTARVDLPYTAFDFIHGPDPTPSTTQAVFLDGTLAVTDRIDLSAGIRYSEDEKDYTFHRHNPDGSDITAADACVLGLPPFYDFHPINCAVAGSGGQQLDGLSAHFQSDRTDYRVALSFDVTDNIMAYAQTSTGYKGGGINARPFVPDQAVSFEPEELTAYEVGFKSTLLDNMIRLNGAYFFNDYQGVQLIRRDCSAVSSSDVCLMPINGGDAEVDGFEAELEAHLTDAFLVDASFSSLSFEYTTINDPSTGITTDMITPYTPETKWSIGAQYELPLGGMGTLTPRIDASYQSEIFTDANNDATNQIDEYTVANVRATWRSPDGDWSIAAQGTNIFEEYYYVTKNDLARQAGFVYGQPGRPREWAVTVKRIF